MKKLLAVLSAALILLSVSACSKTVSTSESTTASTVATTMAKYTDAKEALSGVTLTEEKDNTYIYYLYEDGTYKSTYSGNVFTGKWAVKEDGDYTSVEMTDDDGTFRMYYLTKDSDGYITGIYNPGVTDFTITARSIPENVTAPAAAETEPAAAESTSASTAAASTTSAPASSEERTAAISEEIPETVAAES